MNGARRLPAIFTDYPRIAMHAHTNRNYRTFMLDTTNARLYLEDVTSSSSNATVEEAMTAFRKARELLVGVLTDRDRDQAFRAAERYADFIRRFGRDLAPEARNEVGRAIVHVLRTVQKRGRPNDVGVRVARCAKKLRAALDENFDERVVQEWLSS